MDWTEVLDLVEHRLGIWTGRGTYMRAVALLTGFDLALGGDTLERFGATVYQRHPDAGPTGWPWLVLAETTGSTEEPDPNDWATNRTAVAHLSAELRRFLKGG